VIAISDFTKNLEIQLGAKQITVIRPVVARHRPAVSPQADEDDDYKIAGSGPDSARLNELVRQMGLETTVQLLGHVEDDELDKLFEQCDVFVMVSREEGADVEGFGIVFLEAALRRKPSIAGRTGGVPDAVLDGVTGLLVDPGSAEDVAKALRALLTDPHRARSMGNRAFDRATTEFTEQRQAQRVRELFDRLVPAPSVER
jgi:phosphatidylinositol alpha-1,6-mannosyltransferase